MSLVRKALGFAKVGVAVAKSALRRNRGEEAGGKPLPKGEEKDYTLAELRAFDGSDPERPILLAASGKVFDVTRGRDFYGPRGPYGVFAGKDCSRALAKLSFEASDCTGDVSGLSAGELEKLDDWVATFEMKYPVLGRLVEEGTPPPAVA